MAATPVTMTSNPMTITGNGNDQVLVLRTSLTGKKDVIVEVTSGSVLFSVMNEPSIAKKSASLGTSNGKNAFTTNAPKKILYFNGTGTFNVSLVYS